MPNHARRPLSETQIKRLFYQPFFELKDLLSIIERMEKEKGKKLDYLPQLKKEAENLSVDIAWKIHYLAVSRSLYSVRVLSQVDRSNVRRIMNFLSQNPAIGNIQSLNARLRELLGKKYAPFALEYRRQLDEIKSQVSALLPARGTITHTVFAVPPSSFASIRRLFPRMKDKSRG